MATALSLGGPDGARTRQPIGGPSSALPILPTSLRPPVITRSEASSTTTVRATTTTAPAPGIPLSSHATTTSIEPPALPGTPTTVSTVLGSTASVPTSRASLTWSSSSPSMIPRQALQSNIPAVSLRFALVPDPFTYTCSAWTLSWTYEGLADPASVSLQVQPSNMTDQTLFLAEVDPSAGSYTWGPVNAAPGWYDLTASGAHADPVRFLVQEGSDTSCVNFPTLLQPVTTQPAAQSPTATVPRPPDTAATTATAPVVGPPPAGFSRPPLTQAAHERAELIAGAALAVAALLVILILAALCLRHTVRERRGRAPLPPPPRPLREEDGSSSGHSRYTDADEGKVRFEPWEVPGAGLPRLEPNRRRRSTAMEGLVARPPASAPPRAGEGPPTPRPRPLPDPPPPPPGPGPGRVSLRVDTWGKPDTPFQYADSPTPPRAASPQRRRKPVPPLVVESMPAGRWTVRQDSTSTGDLRQDTMATTTTTTATSPVPSTATSHMYHTRGGQTARQDLAETETPSPVDTILSPKSSMATSRAHRLSSPVPSTATSRMYPTQGRDPFRQESAETEVLSLDGMGPSPKAASRALRTSSPVPSTATSRMYRMRDSGFSTLTRTEDGTVIRTARASSILDPHLLGTLGEMKTMQSVVPDVPALPQV